MKDKIKQLFSENGKLSGKKVLAVTLASTLVLGTGLFAFASTQTATDYNILGQTVHISSQGTIQYDNDNNGTPEVVIDADDIHNIASRLATASAGMDNPDLDNDGNPDSAVTILPNNKLLDASGAYINDTDGNPTSFTKGLVGSLSVDTTTIPSDTPQYDSDGDGTPDSDYIMASADNLSKGKAAWAGNTLLLGTGADNENYLTAHPEKVEEVIKTVWLDTITFVDLGTETSGNITDIVGAENRKYISQDMFMAVPTEFETVSLSTSTITSHGAANASIYASDGIAPVVTYNSRTGAWSRTDPALTLYVSGPSVSSRTTPAKFTFHTYLIIW